MYRFILIAVVFVQCASSNTAADSEQSTAAAAAQIDHLLQQSWQRQAISPAGPSHDAEFLRRVWLDLAGIAPPVSAVRQFLRNQDSGKRERLIDELLATPRHANHMANLWTETLLPPQSPNQVQQQANVAALQNWLSERFRENLPYDHLGGRFLTAGGEGNRGPAIFYTSRGLEPKKVAAATSQVFLGIQLQCAECHDHPFDRWTQEDFWQYAAFFSQLQQTNAGSGQHVIVEDRAGPEVTFPDSDQVALPRYPGVSAPPEEDPQGMRRRQLTIWLASRDNPYFARAAVNRIWAHLFGRGLVEPVDAMDEANQPSHPELLDYLANYIVQQRFNLRSLYATIARTEAYQRTSLTAPDRAPPEDSFAAMSVKTLTPTQYYDSLQQNVFRHNDSSSNQNRIQFINRMRSTGRSVRNYPLGVVQVLGIMNGPEMRLATDTNRLGLLASLEAPFLTAQERIETLFLATVSRFPNDDELAWFAGSLESATTPQARQAAVSDLLWVLLNTAECAVAP